MVIVTVSQSAVSIQHFLLSGIIFSSSPLEIVLLTVLHGVHLLLRNLDVHLVSAHLEGLLRISEEFLMKERNGCWNDMKVEGGRKLGREEKKNESQNGVYSFGGRDGEPQTDAILLARAENNLSASPPEF